jgi:hypothetical protein
MDENITLEMWNELQKQQKELLWENRIQTIALILVFIWGVNTFSDLVKKVK